MKNEVKKDMEYQNLGLISVAFLDVTVKSCD